MSLDPSETLHLPRILCLHGGGVNGHVFRLQLRGFIARGSLSPHFRFVFVDAPYECAPHPAIIQVYGEHAPFYRWLRWQDDHPSIGAQQCSAQILTQIRRAMDADEGYGEWVGVLGFSQGAKIAASLLWLQERIENMGGGGIPLLRREDRFRFGVFFAGSAPIVMLDPTGKLGTPPKFIEGADDPSLAFTDWADNNEGEHVITIPTLHVHGLLDEGIERHRLLLNKYCKTGTTRLVEWSGDHRLPIKSADVALITSKVLEIARETGAMMSTFG